MIHLPESITLPMKTDEQGAIRISNTRVTLDVLIARYTQGNRPEAIHRAFPTIPLTDVYAVIAYYLANRAEVDAYLEQRDAEDEHIRQEIEANYPPEHKARLKHFRRLLAEKHKNESQ